MNSKPRYPGINSSESSLAPVSITSMRAKGADTLCSRGKAAENLPHVRRDLLGQIRTSGGQVQRFLYGLHQSINVLLRRKRKLKLDKDGATDGLNDGASGSHCVLGISIGTRQCPPYLTVHSVEINGGCLGSNGADDCAGLAAFLQSRFAAHQHDFQPIPCQRPVHVLDNGLLPLRCCRVVLRLAHAGNYVRDLSGTLGFVEQVPEKAGQGRSARRHTPDPEIEAALHHQAFHDGC